MVDSDLKTLLMKIKGMRLEALSETERGNRMKWPRMFTFMGTLAIMEYDILFFNKVGELQRNQLTQSHTIK